MRKRFPPLLEIGPVYATIAFMLFAWTALLFFWNLPAWLNFMPLDVALAVFSYSIGASLIESLALLLLLLAICFALPSGWLRDELLALPQKSLGAIRQARFLPFRLMGIAGLKPFVHGFFKAFPRNPCNPCNPCTESRITATPKDPVFRKRLPKVTFALLHFKYEFTISWRPVINLAGYGW